MCGVLALLDPAGVHTHALHSGLEALAHRGPDGRGSWRDGPVGLGHTRLALNGGAGGAQPLGGAGFTGVVNGELYNHLELAPRLRRALPFVSDSEVLLAWLAQEGPSGLSEARGEFAAVLWDGHHILAVRDRFGIKPLYWTWQGRRLALASEPHALLAMGHPARWNAAAVTAMLTHQYLLPDQTVFEGIHVLEPGCWLRARPGRPPRLGHWWSWVGEAPGPAPDAGELREVIAGAVAERCVADQPVACQLSGGLDSAVVAATASTRGVRTAYTVRFLGEAAWDESAGAAEVARHLGLEHRVLPVTQGDLLAALHRAVIAAGGPVINTHASAKWLLCRQVRADGHAVLLSGEGADELFWGYEHLVRDHRRAMGAAEFEPNPAVAGVHLATGESLDGSAVARAWGQVPSFLEAKASLGHRLHQVAEPGMRPDFEPLLAALGPLPPGSPATIAAWAWARLCLAGSILQRLCDPLEMAWGVEGRMPLLDIRVAAAAARIPAAQRVRGAIGKVPLREAAAPLLPPDTAGRAKHPFMGPPLCIDEDLRGRLLDGPALPFISRTRLQRRLDALVRRPAADRVPWDPVWLTVLSCQSLATEYRL